MANRSKNTHEQRRSFDVLATNIRGMGATRLVQSLLPAIEKTAGSDINTIWLPDGGELATYSKRNSTTKLRVYKRRLPNAFSRFFECTIFAARFGDQYPKLILGDLPIRTRALQILFVHSPLLIPGSFSASLSNKLKAKISQWVFRLNIGYVSQIIVQTQIMKAKLLAHYPLTEDKISIIGQPAPEWIDILKGSRTQRRSSNFRLNLFYPAANYPHKNHALLIKACRAEPAKNIIEHITLTLDRDLNDLRVDSPLLNFVGPLNSEGVTEFYRQTDALVFPSLEESYGLPLIEAMIIGLPIVCAARDYAKVLCGKEAIYFDPLEQESLLGALAELQTRLQNGWWPDWTQQLEKIPENWEGVANQMIDLVEVEALKRMK